MTRDAGSSTAGGTTHVPYRSYIDGIRTVAVYSVVAFHAGLGAFVGGFIGVDVFFVLSGFLVTGILVRELQTEGRVGWARFYARRVRRILPAAVATLVVTAFVYGAVAAPADQLSALDGMRAAFLYFANWHFIGQANDYFAQTVDSSPVLHFWSLSIEEQFYFLWPLLLSALFATTLRFGNRQWIVLRSIVASAALASAAGALLIERTNFNLAYYGTHTRAYQLLLGALIALTPTVLALDDRRRHWMRATAVGALGGIVVLSTSFVELGPIRRGIGASLCAALLIVALCNAESGVVARGLSWRPIGYLGRISYGTYLWHWPIVVIAAIEWDLTPSATFAVSALGSTIFAAVSYHVLEIPIRSARLLDRLRRPVVAIGLTVSVIGGLVFAPQVLDSGGSSVVVAEAITLQSGPNSDPSLELLDWRVAKDDIPDYPDCIDAPIDDCTIERGTGLDVLLMGDSNARMWIPAFAAIARKESLTLSVAIQPQCPWQRGVRVLDGNGTMEACALHQTDWYERLLPGLDPDVIVLVHQAYDDPRLRTRLVPPEGGQIRPPGEQFDEAMAEASRGALQDLARPGRHLVIIEPIPIAGTDFDPLTCLSFGGAPSDCIYETGSSPSPTERFYRTLAESGDVRSIDADRLVCPNLPRCDPVVSNIIVKRDTAHLTATFAAAMAPSIEAALREANVLEASKR